MPASRPDLTASTDSLAGRRRKAAIMGITPYEIDDVQHSPCAFPTYLYDSEVYILHCQSSISALKDAENEMPKPPLDLSLLTCQELTGVLQLLDGEFEQYRSCSLRVS